MKDSNNFFLNTFEPVKKRMYSVIWRTIKNPQEAEDVFQDVVAKILEKLPVILQHKNPKALILKICFDMSYDALRKKIRQKKFIAELIIEKNIQGNTCFPDTEIFKEKFSNCLLKKISELPGNQATAIYMRYVDESSYAEISEVLGCNPVTSRIHVLRAKKKLYSALKEFKES